MKPIATGYVISVHRKYFWCRFNSNGTTFEAQISKSKLSDKELPFLQENAYILVLTGGTIRFSRLKGWTKKEIKLAEKRSEKWLELLDIENKTFNGTMGKL